MREEMEMVWNQQAWEECDRADRMIRLLERMAGTPGWPSRQQVILLECDCAETVLGFIPSGENRPKQAIIAARTLARGEDISPAHLRNAADAAAAVDAAYAAAAVSAADAAAEEASIAARKWANGEDISLDQVRAAADAAAAYAVSSSYTDATYAAHAAHAAASYAAATDAASTDVASYAADAVAAAAYEAAYEDYPSEDYAFYAASAARDEKLRELADLIRSQVHPKFSS